MSGQQMLSRGPVTITMGLFRTIAGTIRLVLQISNTTRGDKMLPERKRPRIIRDGDKMPIFATATKCLQLLVPWLTCAANLQTRVGSFKTGNIKGELRTKRQMQWGGTKQMIHANVF